MTAPKNIPEKSSDKRTGRRTGKPVGLASVLPKVTRTAMKRKGFAVGDVVHNWPAIVGAAIAEQSCPESLTFPGGENGHGNLKVRVDGPLAIELQHLAPLVVERVNGYYGYKVVERLTIIQGPVARPTPKRRKPTRPLTADEEILLNRTVADTKDDSLRHALAALGREVLSRR